MCFGGFRRRRWLGTWPTGTVPTVLWSRGRRRTWSAASRRRWASCRAVSEFSSPAWVCIRRRVLPAAATVARKNVTKNVRSPNERRRRMVPHVGIGLPSAPESCGPVGGVFERCGRQCFGSVFINWCLLSSSVAVLLIRARGRLSGWRAAASVVEQLLPAAAAGNGVDGCFIVRIDGGDGVAMGRGSRSRESWMPRGPRWSSCSLSSLNAILDANKGSFTKECGLEVDCNRVQGRACAKAGSTVCRSTCEVLFENVHVG